MLRKTVSWTVLIYGLLLIIFGYLGYSRGGSKISLMVGGGFGVLLILSSFAMFAKNKLGFYISLILTVALTAVFAYRYTLTGKPIAAWLAVLSGAVLLFLLAHIIKSKRKDTF